MGVGRGWSPDYSKLFVMPCTSISNHGRNALPGVETVGSRRIQLIANRMRSYLHPARVRLGSAGSPCRQRPKEIPVGHRLLRRRTAPGIMSLMTPLAKGLGVLFGLPAILAVVFFSYFTVTGADRMKAVCSQVSAGMTRAQLNAFITDKRLDGFLTDGGVSILGDVKSYGRHSCKVTLVAGVVTVAEYLLAD
ncbi:MAG: hypothetical protein JNK59_04390 [Sterolibacteriaceae bacterium]|nr:hypothetical protein [Sterolibacteriaceae bacterium]